MPRKKKNLEDSLKAVLQFCSDNGLSVVFSDKKADQYSYATKTIFIKTNKTKKRQFYYLCHEIGHYICLEQNEYLTASEKGYTYSSFTYRIAKIEEEYDAWKAAESFIQSKSLFIDKEFEMIKALAISSYMIWAHESTHDIKRKVKNAAQKQTNNESGFFSNPAISGTNS